MTLYSLILLTVITASIWCKSERSFTIDYNNNQFLKDGKPFRYVSGSLQYFKVPSVLWADRMDKYRMSGLNAIQTYIEWRSHEPEEGMYDFEGENDLIKYLKTANEKGLLVILRTGPFIDAERDFGGLPYWLLSKNPDMKLRTSDPSYLSEVDKWYSLLLPMLRPMLYRNGGPVIMVQIENEFGAYYSCDYEYLTHLRDLHNTYFDKEVVLFTTDPNQDSVMKCGKIDNVFATVDFGPDPRYWNQSFEVQRRHQEFGPYVNSEFYTGWIDHWEQPHNMAPSSVVCNSLDALLAQNASINLYPFHGGTNFGFNAGSNVIDNKFVPCVTSYDFDAPLNEAGDPTQKYFDVRNIIGKYLPLPNGTLPQPTPKMQIQPSVMNPIVNVFDVISTQSPIYSLYPMTFEELQLRDGFVLYSTNLTFIPSDPAILTIKDLKDRALVFVDRQYSGTLSRTQGVYHMSLDIDTGSQLDILVENQGRVCFGSEISESKGITTNVTLGPYVLKDWNHYLLFKNWSKSIQNLEEYSVDRERMSTLMKQREFNQRIPTFFETEFVLPNTKELPLDSFLRLDGWRKGMAFLNGFNLGRYWTVGPQITLYSPKHLFNVYPETNKLIVFELENYSMDRSIQFVDTSVLNATTPYGPIS